MTIEDERQGISLIKDASLKNITKLQMNDGAGSVTAYTKEGYSITLEYEEIEAFANEMMKKYTGDLIWRTK